VFRFAPVARAVVAAFADGFCCRDLPVADIDRQVKYLRPQPELPTLATNAESGDDLYFRARSITMF